MRVSRIALNDNTYQLRDARSETNFENTSAEFTRLNGVLEANKTILADKITELGVTTYPSDTLLQMAENISLIITGDSKMVDTLHDIYTDSDVENLKFGISYPWMVAYRLGNYTDRNETSVMSYRTEVTDYPEDLFFITRMKLWSTEYYSGSDFCVPVFSATGLVRADIDYIATRKLEIAIDGQSSTTQVDVTSYFGEDQLLDCFVKMTQTKASDTTVLVKIYISVSDEDGKPTSWDLLYTVTTSISTVGYIDITLNGTSNDYRPTNSIKYRYDNTADDTKYKYWACSWDMKQTCVIFKDSDDIYKILLGGSTEYARGDD